jgi:hypothetical protein
MEFRSYDHHGDIKDCRSRLWRRRGARRRNTVASPKTEAAAAKKDTKDRFDGIQTELKKMGDTLIGVARFDERITNLDKRVTSQARKIDDLSRGEGFVRGHRASVDGEY